MTSSDATETRPDDAVNNLALNAIAVTGLAGAIDDARIYNRVLTASEIRAVYAKRGQ